MSDNKTGFALVPKSAKKEEPSKIFGVETRTLIALGALGIGTYLLMTHDPLEGDDELAPPKDNKEPDWWREARENDRIGVRGARRAGAGFDAGTSEVDRMFEEEADAVERDELAAMKDEDEGEEEVGEEEQDEFEEEGEEGDV